MKSEVNTPWLAAGCFISSVAYPAPAEHLLSPYLDALGQLLVQTLAQNKIVPHTSIWGEDNMLNWYLTLRKEMPLSEAPGLMYMRGVLASVEYGGKAGKKFAPGLVADIESSQTDSVIFKLSPIVFEKLKDHAKCETQKVVLLKTASGLYRDWLNTIKCSDSK